MMSLSYIPTLLVAFAIFSGTNELRAQTPVATGGQETVLRVQGLTSAQRDQLVQELANDEVQLVFACVPAGILVFRSAQATPAGLQQRSVAVASARSRSREVSVLPISLLEAEEQCAQARNR